MIRLRCGLWGLWAFCQLAPACENLVVREAWIREGPPGAAVLAGFGELVNSGTKSLRITGVDSPRFGHAMLHETVYRKGEARMVAREVIDLAPGARVKLAPGGLHLMLMHGDATVTAGQQVPIDIVCGETRARFPFVVMRAAP